MTLWKEKLEKRFGKVLLASFLLVPFAGGARVQALCEPSYALPGLRPGDSFGDGLAALGDLVVLAASDQRLCPQVAAERPPRHSYPTDHEVIWINDNHVPSYTRFAHPGVEIGNARAQNGDF